MAKVSFNSEQFMLMAVKKNKRQQHHLITPNNKWLLWRVSAWSVDLLLMWRSLRTVFGAALWWLVAAASNQLLLVGTSVNWSVETQLNLLKYFSSRISPHLPTDQVLRVDARIPPSPRGVFVDLVVPVGSALSLLIWLWVSSEVDPWGAVLLVLCRHFYWDRLFCLQEARFY